MSAVVRVSGVSKVFRIPLDRSTTLKHRIVHLRSSGRYRELAALDDVSFDVPAGQFLGIIGANGCGKSTLLKLLAGIYVPTRGRVELRGKVAPFLELGVGFNPELTARENIFLNGAVLGISRSELERRVDGIISFAGLEAFADQKIKNFSSGMEVRLAFAVAVQADAAVLLMDEVLAVGDAQFQTRCFDVFARYKREGRTVILVTHDLGAVERYCDRAILLDHGHLLDDGSAAGVTARYRRMVGEQADADALAARDGGGPASAAAAPGDTGDARARWGTGEILIRAVRLLGGGGEEHRSFMSGRPLTVRIELEVVSAFEDEDLIFGFILYRADGAPLAAANTLELEGRYPCPPSGTRFHVDYRIATLQLLTGSYLLSVGVQSRERRQPSDLHELAYHFEVVDPIGREGIFTLGGSWSLDGELSSRAEPTPRRPS